MRHQRLRVSRTRGAYRECGASDRATQAFSVDTLNLELDGRSFTGRWRGIARDFLVDRDLRGDRRLRAARCRLGRLTVAGWDTRALTRAFSTLSRQNVSFDRCEITVDGARATAQCDGAIEYVRRVGDSTPHSRTTSWAFALDRAAGTWRISNVTAR